MRTLYNVYVDIDISDEVYALLKKIWYEEDDRVVEDFEPAVLSILEDILPSNVHLSKNGALDSVEI